MKAWDDEEEYRVCISPHTVYFSSSDRGSAVPAPPCSPFNHNGRLCKHKAKVPSRVGQGYHGPRQCTQRTTVPVELPVPIVLQLHTCVSSMKTFTCIDMQPESVCEEHRGGNASKQAMAMAARVSNLGNAKCQPQVPHPHYSKKGRTGQINARIAHKLRTGTAAGGPQMVGTHTQSTLPDMREQEWKVKQSEWIPLGACEARVALVMHLIWISCDLCLPSVVRVLHFY